METLSLLFINYIHLVKYSMLQLLTHYIYNKTRRIFYFVFKLFLYVYILE